MSTSWMEKVEAVPMCDSPVTLGRGSMITNGSRDGSTGAWKYPLSIQVLYHASSTWRGSYVAGRVFVVIARRPPFTTNKNARPIQDGAFAPRYHPCSTPHQRRNASRAVTGPTRFAPGRPSPPGAFRRSSSRWTPFPGGGAGLVDLGRAHRVDGGGVAVLGEPQPLGEFLRDVVRLPERWAQPPHQSLPDGGDQR